MSDADRLRDLAECLLLLALKAREKGQIAYADELTELASDSMVQALAIKVRGNGRSQAHLVVSA